MFCGSEGCCLEDYWVWLLLRFGTLALVIDTAGISEFLMSFEFIHDWRCCHWLLILITCL